MYKTVLALLIFLIAGCVPSEPSAVKKVIETGNAPGAIGIYSQGIQIGNTVYVSGQIGLAPETRTLAGEDLESQTHQAIKNIRAILEAAGYSLSDVVSANVFLSDMNDYQAFNEIYVQYFTENPPARAVVEVSRIPLDAKVEIKVTAAK